MSKMGVLIFLIALGAALLLSFINAPLTRQNKESAVNNLQELHHTITLIEFDEQMLPVLDLIKIPLENSTHKKFLFKLKISIAEQICNKIRPKYSPTEGIKVALRLFYFPVDGGVTKFLEIKNQTENPEYKLSRMKAIILNLIEQQVKMLIPLIRMEEDVLLENLSALHGFVSRIELNRTYRTFLKDITLELFQRFSTEFTRKLGVTFKNKFNNRNERNQSSAVLRNLVIHRTYFEKVMELKRRLLNQEINQEEFLTQMKNDLLEMIASERERMVRMIVLLKKIFNTN